MKLKYTTVGWFDQRDNLLASFPCHSDLQFLIIVKCANMEEEGLGDMVMCYDVRYRQIVDTQGLWPAVIRYASLKLMPNFRNTSVAVSKFRKNRSAEVHKHKRGRSVNRVW